MEEYRLTVNSETSSIAQFQIMDWGMESCQLVIHPPAVNDTNSFSMIRFPGVIDVWVLEPISDSYLQRPTWSRKPKRAKLLASMEVSYGAETRSPTFSCLSASLHGFEVACASNDPGCQTDLMRMGWKRNVLYIEQSQSH
ncbi:hypothetical protein VNI00_015602 [Paramarasmius palmivorus]|uniref:Ubiquitin 3 binding protein But2 C-terminal domain-containing protein n=1 Tax=Paramarasmius palmivorus TaxID=297713 RepID=A0AAW0BKH8_9AGAR